MIKSAADIMAEVGSDDEDDYDERQALDSEVRRKMSRGTPIKFGLAMQARYDRLIRRDHTRGKHRQPNPFCTLCKEK